MKNKTMGKKDLKEKKELPIKDSFRILSFIFAAILITACNRNIVFPVSEVVPAAEAVLKVDENDNNNYELELEVENLAEARRLTPARKHYVVWMVTKRNGTINLGNLDINRKNRGVIKTSTPYQPIRVFITAEDDPTPVVPSTQVIMNSGEFKT